MADNKTYIKTALSDIRQRARKDIRHDALKRPDEYADLSRNAVRYRVELDNRYTNWDWQKFLMDKLWGEIYLQVVEGAKDIIFKLQKKMAVHEVNATTAKCLVEARMKEHGWSYIVDPLLEKVKVQIVLARHKKAVFYLKYSCLTEEITKMENAMQQLRDIYTSFGSSIAISEIKAKDEWK